MAEATERTRWQAWLAAAAVLTVAVAGTVAAVQLLHARASQGDALAHRPPLTVATRTIQRTEHYVERERFVGRIEPARETLIAAERAGLLVDLLVEEGDWVEAGQPLAQLDLRPLHISRDRLTAERESIEADIALAERTTDRRARLVGEGWASGQAFDEARFSISALTARRASVEAQIAQVDLDIAKSTVAAPFAGRIAERRVDEGAVIAAGTPLVLVQEAGRPRARIGVPFDRGATLKPGDEATLDHLGQALPGLVSAVIADMDQGTRTVPVLIDIETVVPLAMGQVVRLNLERRIETAGAWVDLSALQEAERGLWSLLVIEDDIVRSEAVEILHIAAGRAFVRGTFADGARVVVAGPHRVSVGQAVAVSEGPSS